MNDTLPVTRVPLPHVAAEIINAPAGGLDSGPVQSHAGRLLRDVSVERRSVIRFGWFLVSVLSRSSWRRCRPRFTRREPSV